MDDSMRLPSCSIGRAMDILGERWTLLILRECFYGVRRFSVMQRNLGIARNILSARLQLLVRTGILERRRYQEEPERFEYKLTQKGLGLYPAVVAIMRWGDEHLCGGDAPVVLRHTCGGVADPVMVCSHCRAGARPARRDPGARGRAPASVGADSSDRRMSVQGTEQQLWGGETTKAVANFPVSGRAGAAAGRALARPRQGRRRARQRGAGAAGRRARREDRHRRRRDRSRHARRRSSPSTCSRRARARRRT